MTKLEKREHKNIVKEKSPNKKKTKIIFIVIGIIMLALIIGGLLIFNGLSKLSKDAVMHQIEKHEMENSDTTNPYSALGVEDYIYSEKEMSDTNGEAQYSIEYYDFKDKKDANDLYDDINLVLETMRPTENPEVIKGKGSEMTIVESEDIYSINILSKDKLVTILGMAKDKEELRNIANELIEW